MQFITDILVGFLTAYIAFTNFLALQILHFVEPDTETPTQEISVKDESSITTLPSKYLAAIPTILRDSLAYQQAAVLGSTDNSAPAATDSPISALVNIYCTFITPTHIRTTTGTGFFVSNQGVILTNAHVAQFLLLEKTDVLGDADCIIRTGDPASPRYQAELLYLPPAWVVKHAAMIEDNTPTGTGERDYALLYVTNGIENAPLPASFPSLKVDTALLPKTVQGSEVVVAGYPAESILLGNIDSDLTPKSANSTLTELYTFGSNYADVISIKGSVIGEHGSSGGPVLSSTGAVIGMITTKGNDDLDGIGSLRAITLSHINRTILEETGFSFNRHISGDVALKAQVFTDTMAPFLTGLLTHAVDSNN